MELLLPSILLTYSICWYVSFHLLNAPPTEYINVTVYYLTLSHLILSVTYLLFIHPLNTLADFTEPTQSLNAHMSVACELKNVKTVKQQAFDNEALHRKARLTKSGSFPADSSSGMRRRHGPARLDHKQREIWPPSISANGNDISVAKTNARVYRRGLSLSELEYNSFISNMDEIGSIVSSLEYRDEIIMSEGCESVFQSQSTFNHGKGENVHIETEDVDDEYSLCALRQPLQPDLFEEIQTQYRDVRKQDRKLIYDLINEALAFVNKRRYLYFSFHLHPVPKEQHILDQVRAFVGRRLNWIPDIDNLLESAIDESSWNGGWMNLQIESECSALDLGDLILDELLNEILLC